MINNQKVSVAIHFYLQIPNFPFIRNYYHLLRFWVQPELLRFQTEIFFFFGLSLRFKEISNISTNTDIVAPGQQFNGKMTPTNIWQSVWVWLACSNLWSKLDRDFLGQVASHQASCAINLQCVIIFNQTESRGWMVLQPLGNQMFATTICNVITQQSTIFPSFKDVAVFFFTLMKPRHKIRYKNTFVTNRESIHPFMCPSFRVAAGLESIPAVIDR